MIILTPMVTKSIQNNDISYLIETSKGIVTNDARIDEKKYGVVVYDYNLEEKYNIPFEGHEQFGIYSYFKNKVGNQLLFYCADDERIIYVDLQQKTSKTFSGPSPKKLIFSKCYWWDSDELILSDYNENFFKVAIDSAQITPVDISLIKNDFPAFYNFYKQSLGAQSLYPFLYQYIVANDETIELVDMVNNKKIAVPNFCPHAYEYRYRDGFFLCTSESEIVLISARTKKNIKLERTKYYRFLRAIFVAEQSFMTLSKYGTTNELTLYSFMENNS